MTPSACRRPSRLRGGVRAASALRMVRRRAHRYPAAMDTPSSPRDVAALRASLAHATRRGLGMTLASCVYWAGLAGVVAWAGLAEDAIAMFFLVATVIVYPLGWMLDRLVGGDLLARGHPFSHLVWALAATQVLGWPSLVIVFVQAPHLLAFALAALLGAHFLPYGWLYRSTAYYALGIGTVLVAAGVQCWLPRAANVAIPLAMLACYALASLGVWRGNRASGMHAC